MVSQRHYLKEWRKAKGLTQQKLADRSGVARTQIAKFETGARVPDLADLEFLAGALGVKPVDLVGRPPDDPARLLSLHDELDPEQREELAEIAELMLRRAKR
jgi:transcriptional regulator with XRE-family HTH domain